MTHIENNSTPSVDLFEHFRSADEVRMRIRDLENQSLKPQNQTHMLMDIPDDLTDLENVEAANDVITLTEIDTIFINLINNLKEIGGSLKIDDNIDAFDDLVGILIDTYGDFKGETEKRIDQWYK
jgi:hypothetical protein